MQIVPYICIGLSILLLIIIVKIMRIKEKKRILRYHGVSIKKRK